MGRKKLAEGKRRTRFVQIRVSPPYKEWLDRYAESKNLSITSLILGLLAKSAARDRFDQSPKRSGADT